MALWLALANEMWYEMSGAASGWKMEEPVLDWLSTFMSLTPRVIGAFVKMGPPSALVPERFWWQSPLTTCTGYAVWDSDKPVSSKTTEMLEFVFYSTQPSLSWWLLCVPETDSLWKALSWVLRLIQGLQEFIIYWHSIVTKSKMCFERSKKCWGTTEGRKLIILTIRKDFPKDPSFELSYETIRVYQAILCNEVEKAYEW